MSWESELGHIVKYNHWPNPFRNMVKSINVLACEGTWEAMIEMYAVAFGNWFWSNFVPSPFEITRKVFTGSYKCGFYFGPKVKSPLDFVWEDGETSRALGSILRPVTQGLFYMWAGQTIWEALQTWQSLLYAMEMCDWDGNTTTMADASAPINTHHVSGSPAFANVIWDPRSRAEPNNTQVIVSYETVWQCHFVGYFVSSGDVLTNCKVGFTINGVQQQLTPVADVGAGQVKAFAITVEGTSPILVAQPYFECDSNQAGVLPSDLLCSRFIVNAWPPNFPMDFPAPITPGSLPVVTFCDYYE